MLMLSRVEQLRCKPTRSVTLAHELLEVVRVLEEFQRVVDGMHPFGHQIDAIQLADGRVGGHVERTVRGLPDNP